MAQPQITKTKWSPQQGGLVADIDPKDLSGGNLLVNGVNTGGMNVRNVGKGQNVMMDYEPIYGNEFVYDLDTLLVQNKKWRIYADVTDVPYLTGADLIVNGDFATNLNDWDVSPAGRWVYNAGVAQCIPGVGTATISQYITAPYGSYTLTFDFPVSFPITAGSCVVSITDGTNSVLIANITANGSYNYTFDSTQSNFFTLEFSATNTFDGSLDNVTLVLNNQLYGFDYTISSSSGSLLLSGAGNFGIVDAITNTLSAIDTFITTDFASYTPVTSSVITGSYTGYVEFEFTFAPYFDYDLQFDDTFSSNGTFSLVIVEEAIDPSCLGEWNLIGSDDKPSDSFQFWTTRIGLPQDLEIFNITDNGSGVIRISTVEPNTLVQNQAVRISLVDGAVEANGIWTIDVIDPFTFDLYNSSYISSYVSGGIITYGIYGVGEIGVAVKDSEGVISYTRLLRSKEFNFSTLKQIDCRAKRKQDIQKFAVYYTDNYNLPRVFYYKGVYQADGALNYIVSDNIYEYGNIASESRWVLNNEDFRIEVIGQDQSGGSIKTGNWRYSARLLTANFTATNWCQLTEGIPVFTDPTTDVNLIGNNPDVPTSKVNKLKLTNNMIGVFTYVEIAALNYINNLVPFGYTIGRYQLNQNTEQFFNHTGNEPEQLDLDTGTLNDFSQAFIKAQNVELLDNRAILSNLTPAQTLDFTQWVETFKYSLNRHILDPIGAWSANTLQLGEYKDPMNVYSYKSHMMMETYRYGFRFKLKSGALTQVFYPGYDINIDPIVVSDPTRPEKLVGTFSTYDLTNQATFPTGGPTEVYSIYIGWENINLSFLIDGVPAYDLVDEIIPCRAEVVREVLLHGNLALGVSGNFGDVGVGDLIASQATSTVSAYPFAFGGNGFFASSPGIFNDSYPGTPSAGSSFVSQRRSFFFYSPDLYFDLVNINYNAGDQIIVFGNPSYNNTLTYQETAFPGMLMNYYREYDGYTNVLTPTIYDFPSSSESVVFLHPGNIETKLIDGVNHGNTIRYRVWNGAFSVYGYQGVLVNEKSVVGRVSNGIFDNNAAGNADYGFYRAIYFRPLSNKYGESSNTAYTEFLPPFIIGDNKGLVLSGDFKTFGDVFTQKTYLKQRYPLKWDEWCGTLTPTPPFNCGTWGGFGAGIGYYTQNINNIQLRCNVDETFDDQYLPTNNINAWIGFGYNNTISSKLYIGGKDAQLFYNTGYTPTNNIITQRAFNPLLEYQTDWGNAVAWSDSESEGSNTDNLRNFPPLNLKFLDYTQGPITDARAMNGELYTIQNTEIQRQYFNSTAMTTTTGGEVYLGTGAVLSRRGTTMNKFGSRHKWSIIMGLSDKGSDVLYGFDDINNTVWRLGYDGTNSLDEIQGMKSFFANNLSWIRGKYTPANDEGIRGVANQRYREVIWTLRGRKQYPEWQQEDNIYYVFDFESNIGKELVYNGNLASSGTLNGWESLDATPPYAPNLAWEIQYILSLNSYAANNANSGLAGILTQTTPIPFIAGNTYLISINIPTSPTGAVGVGFQTGVLAFSLQRGINQFNYVAQSGDDNVYISAAAGANAYVSSVSVIEVLNTNGNWTGSPDWILSNNEACTTPVGTPVSTSIIQNESNYITPNMPWTVELAISDYTSGDLRIGIGNVTTPPLGISGTGSYFGSASPTATGIVRFNPSPTFEGCIKGNIKVYTTGVLKVYNNGDIVQTSGYGTIMSTWSQTPDIWICLKNNVTSNPYFPPNPLNPDWQLIPHTNPNYYTEYTIVYNELKNKFQTFMTILPKIYAHFQNGYLVPRPISDTGRMYVSDTGTPTTWFAEGIDAQSESAYLDAVINQPAGRKRYLAARVESDVAPTSMTVTSSTGSSSTSAAEFEQREGQEFDGYVKDTSTENIIMGDYGVFRFTFAAGTYNKLNSFIASVRERARKWFR